MKELEEKVYLIEQRNKRVEIDKAWEISKLRIAIIIIITYIFASLYLAIADTTNPFLGAFVPCLGFLLSTHSLKLVKKWWIKKYK